jgi:protein translocase SecG subunit
MELETILKYALVVNSIALSIFIVLQSGKGGLGTVFGGTTGGEGYRSKRGLEATLFNGTIVLTILFAILSIGIAILNA